MAITVSGTSITFNDATVQTTAPSASFSGSTTTTGSSALTLTSASTQYQVVQISSYANSIVNLPNATTLTTKGFAPYVIANNTPIAAQLVIKNNAGTIIGAISAGSVATIALTDNSTAAGTWVISTAPSVVTIDSASFATATQATTGQPIYVGLTSTLFVRIWTYTLGNNTTSTVYYQAFTISGSTITAGAIANDNYVYGTLALRNYARAIRLSNTAFVVLLGFQGELTNYDPDYDYYGYTNYRTCTVSGTTITRGTAATLVNVTTGAITNNSTRSVLAAQNGKITRLSDTSFAIVYNATPGSLSYNNAYGMNPSAYAGSLACIIVTVSGTTQTIGTAVNLGTSTYTAPNSLCAPSSTQVFLCYNQWSVGVASSVTKIVTISVSGTVPTWNTPVTIDTTNVRAFGQSNYLNSAVAVSASQVIFNTNYSIAEATISGTVPTFDANVVIGRDVSVNNGFSYCYNTLYLTSASKIININLNSQGVFLNAIYLTPVTGGATQTGDAITVLQTNSAYTSGTLLSPLGAQPTTAFCGEVSTNQIVLIGTTQ